MKTLKKLVLLLILSFTSLTAHASYEVVFELTSEDVQNWETLLNNLENVKKELGPKTILEVVAHGNGIGMFLKKSDFQKERILRLSHEGVRFLGCENTMKRKNIKREDLYNFVGTVPSGVAEVVKKQREGWAYIKIGH